MRVIKVLIENTHHSRHWQEEETRDALTARFFLEHDVEFLDNVLTFRLSDTVCLNQHTEIYSWIKGNQYPLISDEEVESPPDTEEPPTAQLPTYQVFRSQRGGTIRTPFRFSRIDARQPNRHQ